MSKKKSILFIYSASIFPVTMASKKRVLNMLKWLAKDHVIDFAFIDRGRNDLKLHSDFLSNICRKIISIPAINPYGLNFQMVFWGIKIRMLSLFSGLPPAYIYQSQEVYLNFIKNIIIENRYDIVQIEYCFMSAVFKYIDKKTYKVIDTHGIAYKDEELRIIKKYNNNIPKRYIKKIKKIKELESSILNSSDLNISITSEDDNYLVDLAPNVNRINIPIGEDIGYYSNYELKTDFNTVLFYGSMGGLQNKYAFFRFWKNIYPVISNRLKELKVLIVGANPPAEIKELHDGKKIIVTGYVEDTRPYLSLSSVMILPLEIGVGFRGRAIEVMAMGIPIVGTHNAMDNLGLQNGKQGFITDDDSEMADYLCNIVEDKAMRKAMSEECKEFVKRFDFNETYGKLSKFYSDLNF